MFRRCCARRVCVCVCVLCFGTCPLDTRNAPSASAFPALPGRDGPQTPLALPQKDGKFESEWYFATAANTKVALEVCWGEGGLGHRWWNSGGLGDPPALPLSFGCHCSRDSLALTALADALWQIRPVLRDARGNTVPQVLFQAIDFQDSGRMKWEPFIGYCIDASMKGVLGGQIEVTSHPWSWPVGGH